MAVCALSTGVSLTVCQEKCLAKRTERALGMSPWQTRVKGKGWIMRRGWLAAFLAACMLVTGLQGPAYGAEGGTTEQTAALQEVSAETETEAETGAQIEAESEMAAQTETDELGEPEPEAEASLQGVPEDGDAAGGDTRETADLEPADASELSGKDGGSGVSETKDQKGSSADRDEQDAPDDEKMVWEDGHAPLVQGGDLEAQHFTAEDAAAADEREKEEKAVRNALKRGSSLTKAQAVEGLKARFSQAFASYAAVVDISDFDLYLKDFAPDEQDGAAIVTQAYQGAVSGENFYVTGDFKIGASDETGQIQRISIGYGSSFRKSAVPEDGALPGPDTAAIKKAVTEFESALAQARKIISAGSDDLEKILLLHDYLVTECTYDFGGNGASHYYPDDDYTAYGALVKRKAVCNGYAFAFSWLARSFGIETYIMASESMDHAWNLVKINGAWHHVDVTRDDPVFGKGVTYFGINNADAADEGYVSHQFFLKSDTQMRSLGYSKWAVQASDEAVPAASALSSYTGYLFRRYPDGAFAKISGKWYLGALAERKIYESSSLTAANASAVYTDSGMLYAIGRGSLVYFCRADGVFAFDPSARKVLTVSLFDGSQTKVTEMGIEGGKLVILTQDASGNTKRAETAMDGLQTASADGWLSLPDGSLKYFSNGKVLTGRQKISGSWYYLDPATGIRQSGWIKDGSYRYYFDPDSGKALTGWQVLGKKGYYFKTSTGRALTGKRKIGGRYYTFSSTGVLKKSPAKALTGKYFFNKKGKPVKGWKKIGSKKYYFNKKTYKYTTGLVKIGKYRYYFNSKGVMKTGFRTINGRKYYFKSNGRMDAGWVETADGNLQYMKSGKIVKGLQTIYGKEFYFNSKGYLQTGLVRLGTKVYYFKENGGRAKNSYVTLTNADGTKKLGFFDKDGVRVTGKISSGGNTLYLLANDGKLSATEKRQAVTTMALYYLKTKQGSSGHYKLVDTYNATPSSWKRKYTVKYTDQWCATAVSAWGILCGMEDLLLPECSCRYMVKSFQSIGRWQESDAYVPQMGDIVMYNWQDSGKGDNTGTPDHVGIVLDTFVRSGSTYFRVIEGNCAFNITTGNVISSAEKKAGKGVDGKTYFRGVGIRTMKVNARYIRGFCLPAYE